MHCGREVGGHQAAELGVCPAALETRLHGIHDGANAGRACWVVAGTLCEGAIAGTFANKYRTCLYCRFYERVKQDECECFVHPGELLARLERPSAPRSQLRIEPGNGGGADDASGVGQDARVRLSRKS